MKSTFKDLDEAYRHSVDRLTNLAAKFIYNQDLAIDAVHEAFADSVRYFKKNPDKKISINIIRFLVLKKVKKMNKMYGVDIPSGTMKELDKIMYGEQD